MGGWKTGVMVRAGFEAIKNFKLGGIVPPLTFTPVDHEGGGWVRIFQVKGDEFVPATDWMQGYRSDVMQLITGE